MVVPGRLKVVDFEVMGTVVLETVVGSVVVGSVVVGLLVLENGLSGSIKGPAPITGQGT